MTTGLSADSFDPEQHCNWKNEDESDITRDVDVLVWWRDVGQDRFPRTSGDITSRPGYSCGQCNILMLREYMALHTTYPLHLTIVRTYTLITIDSGIGLSITIDKLQVTVFIKKTLSILSAYQQELINRRCVSTVG
jgi:hypothetical protein